jgi:hypothetical protein
MTPEDLKKLLRIEIAVLKFDIAQIIEDKVNEVLADKAQHWKEEQARKREATWS